MYNMKEVHVRVMHKSKETFKRKVVQSLKELQIKMIYDNASYQICITSNIP